MQDLRPPRLSLFGGGGGPPAGLTGWLQPLHLTQLGPACRSLIDSIEAHFGDYGVGSCQQTINGAPRRPGCFAASNAGWARALSAAPSQMRKQLCAVRGISRDTGFSSIRCPREHERMIRTALTFITEIRGKRALVSVKHVGGASPTRDFSQRVRRAHRLS